MTIFQTINIYNRPRFFKKPSSTNKIEAVGLPWTAGMKIYRNSVKKDHIVKRFA